MRFRQKPRQQSNIRDLPNVMREVSIWLETRASTSRNTLLAGAEGCRDSSTASIQAPTVRCAGAENPMEKTDGAIQLEIDKRGDDCDDLQWTRVSDVRKSGLVVRISADNTLGCLSRPQLESNLNGPEEGLRG